MTQGKDNSETLPSSDRIRKPNETKRAVEGSKEVTGDGAGFPKVLVDPAETNFHDRLLCRACRQLRSRLMVVRQHSFQASYLYVRGELRGWSNGWAVKSTGGSESRACMVAQNSSSSNPTTSSCTDVV